MRKRKESKNTSFQDSGTLSVKVRLEWENDKSIGWLIHVRRTHFNRFVLICTETAMAWNWNSKIFIQIDNGWGRTSYNLPKIASECKWFFFFWWRTKERPKIDIFFVEFLQNSALRRTINWKLFTFRQRHECHIIAHTHLWSQPTEKHDSIATHSPSSSHDLRTCHFQNVQIFG